MLPTVYSFIEPDLVKIFFAEMDGTSKQVETICWLSPDHEIHFVLEEIPLDLRAFARTHVRHLPPPSPPKLPRPANFVN